MALKWARAPIGAPYRSPCRGPIGDPIGATTEPFFFSLEECTTAAKTATEAKGDVATVIRALNAVKK